MPLFAADSCLRSRPVGHGVDGLTYSRTEAQQIGNDHQRTAGRMGRPVAQVGTTPRCRHTLSHLPRPAEKGRNRNRCQARPPASRPEQPRQDRRQDQPAQAVKDAVVIPISLGDPQDQPAGPGDAQGEHQQRNRHQ